MAGRGRGKQSISFNTEQLGISKGEMLSPTKVLQPAQPYPLLERKPLPIETNNETDYLLELKREFAEYMQESSNYLKYIIIKKDIERYSDRYQDMMTDNTDYESRFNWSMMPAELRPSRKRKISVSLETNKKSKIVDIEKKLEELEKKEIMQQGDTEVETKKEEETEENQVEEQEDVEKVDEEMDDGTDYANNFFDNGECFDEEDDNLDDGPVY